MTRIDERIGGAGVSRRSFLAAGSGVAIGIAGVAGVGGSAGVALGAPEGGQGDGGGDGGIVGEGYPTTESARARAFVGACHVRFDRVREMLGEDAGLAKASWDWGFGDWESGIGACSHTGRKDIIELLIGHGARPTLFTLAALDEVDAVRALVGRFYGEGGDGKDDRARGEIEGPHSISLYEHAQAGDAARVMEYLESIGRGERPDPVAMDRAAAARLLGVYAFGPGPGERFEVGWFERRSALTLARGVGGEARNLMPLGGGDRFSPAGARHVVVLFEGEAGGEGAAARVVVPRVDGQGGALVGVRV